MSRALRSPTVLATWKRTGSTCSCTPNSERRTRSLTRTATDRGLVGQSAQLPGFGPYTTVNDNNVRRNGGHGTIPYAAGGVPVVNPTNVQSIVGNVRNPVTNTYYARSDPNGLGFTRTFPGAAAYCAANANLPQNVPGSCVTDLWRQFGQVTPDQKTANFFGRFAKQINAQTEAYAELNYYKTETRVQGGGRNVGFTPDGGVTTPGGVPISNTANAVLGANHPDNPYFGTAARLQYNPILEIGPRVQNASSNSVRLVAGLKGTVAAWDYDTAIMFAENKQSSVTEKTLDRLVSNALLNPTAANMAAAAARSPAYAALPAGTVWRIGENANLNSQAMYAALLKDQTTDGFSRYTSVDFKASRELGKLEGGPIGLAVGAEYRRESAASPLFTGLGDYIGVSLLGGGSGSRNVLGIFGEVLLPVTKRIELTAALRADKYSDAGTSYTPKVGAKWRATDTFALRGTYAEGFRAPSTAENSLSALAAFGGATVNDRARVAAGVADAASVAPTFIQRGNPNLEPEKSKSTTLGMVWDITPKSSVSVDLWQIKRKGLPVIDDPQSAVDAGRVQRDTDPGSKQTPTDPGPILAGFVTFQNSSESMTRGVDLDAKHRIDLGGGNGRVTLGANWTHLFTQRIIEENGTVHDYAGTHGDCNITNCMGTPKDRISLNAAWDIGAWRVGAVANYRGSMSNKNEQSDTGCIAVYADGSDAPGGCKIKSFTTVDMSLLWKFRPNTEIFGSIQNVFDKKPPFDPTTYGAISYNPLDYSGAVGRYFKIGLKHKF